MIERQRDLLLGVWREACRHIEITEAVGNLARLLARHLPLATLLVRRFDGEALTVETVAVGAAVGPPFSGSVQAKLTPSQWKRLLAWGRSGNSLHGDLASRPGHLAMLVPPEVEGDVFAGPLVNAEGPAGALVLVAEPQQKFLATHLGIFEQLLEPFSVGLENHCRLHELRALREAAEADRRSLLSRLGRQDFNEAVVGAETGLRHVMERVELVAHSDVPVLILGETGTGKEVVSRAIHTRSKRADGPFIRVNCGAIPPDLIDSQLFGHERGSFTGALEQHQGWFERADEGTLFLDEIGELPLAAQVRLLRVLQDHQVERVGGKQAIHVDVRIVAATHRDLAMMVKARTFREDLWYRINVFPILLPRLRERTEDISALVRHFCQRAAHRFGLSPVEATPAELQLLINYHWPGNIRELGAVIDRAVILGNGRSLEVAQALGFGQTLTSAQPPSDELTFCKAIPQTVVPLMPALPSQLDIVSLDDAIKQHIEKALVATRGQIEGQQGAAAILGINPHTLRARMRKLRIEWSRYRSR